eukprot:TRINITY_DN12848_c0_g1_i2.p1 TRINITY_DN12848_c0_g1~~TRINITY_DN12848_c0_g1_i2.p1  ORF type:complete len:219 (-),score=32.84 TRINITY_DN12848_c0_g1_i2:100-756(-)
MRNHAVFEVTVDQTGAKKLRIKDLGSLNGTFIQIPKNMLLEQGLIFRPGNASKYLVSRVFEKKDSNPAAKLRIVKENEELMDFDLLMRTPSIQGAIELQRIRFTSDADSRGYYFIEEKSFIIIASDDSNGKNSIKIGSKVGEEMIHQEGVDEVHSVITFNGKFRLSDGDGGLKQRSTNLTWLSLTKSRSDMTNTFYDVTPPCWLNIQGVTFDIKQFTC